MTIRRLKKHLLALTAVLMLAAGLPSTSAADQYLFSTYPEAHRSDLVTDDDYSYLWDFLKVKPRSVKRHSGSGWNLGRWHHWGKDLAWSRGYRFKRGYHYKNGKSVSYTRKTRVWLAVSRPVYCDGSWIYSRYKSARRGSPTHRGRRGAATLDLSTIGC
jgi:hypothetical protein